MKTPKNGSVQFFIAIAAALAVTVTVIACSFAAGNRKVVYNAAFWFICSDVRDNSLSADALSGNTSNGGGAGYILEYDGKFYVTVAMYYSENDALSVLDSLAGRGEECTVLSVKKDEYPLNSPLSEGKTGLYAGNLNTLCSLSRMCYECANGLDNGQIGQNGAKGVISDILGGLNGLLQANGDNCFTPELKRLCGECESISSGYVLSKNLRKLQIAIADTIINIRLY